MRAVQFTGVGSVELAEVPEPVPGPADVVVAVAAVGICGTDLHILEGDHLTRGWPLIPGHEFAGTVVAVGAEVGSVRVGDRVAADPNIFCGLCHYCRGGLANQCENFEAVGVTQPGAAAEYVRVPAGNCVVLPDGVDVADAILIEPLSCAVRGFDVLAAKVGAHVLIYGAGTMGLMMTSLAQRAGAASVSTVDPNTARLEVAASLGARTAARAGEISRPRGWDVVIDCTGVPAAIEDGIGRVGRGGTFLQFGVAATEARVQIDPYRIYNEEITIRGSMAVLNSFERAADLFAAGVLDTATFITHTLPLERYADALDLFRVGEGRKIRLTP